jgi:ABC-2 type transport system permease protein
MKPPIRKNILKSLLIKEFKQIFRDKRMRITLFLSPMIMLFLLGYAVNTDVKMITMAVFDEDKSGESRKFIQKFISSNYFLYHSDLASGKGINLLLDKGEAEIFLHIPVGFSKDVKSGRHTNVQLILDGTDSNRASVIVSYATQITNEFSLDYFKDRIRMLVLSRSMDGIRMKENIVVRERVLFNPELASRNFYLPGVLGLLISIVTIMLTSMAVVKEKESGTIEQIIVSPLRPVEYIAGKTLPFAIIGFADIFLIIFITIIFFGVPFNGSFIFLLFSGIVYIISSLSIGLYISTISRTQQQAMLSTFIYFMPAMLFSGFIFPIYTMPLSIQIITYFNPLRYFITIIRGVFLKGVGITVLWPELSALLLIGSLLFTLSVRRFARRME